MTTTPRILVAGDANLDLVLRGDILPRFGQAEQLLESADLVLGSSAGICAAGLARLGVETSIAGRVGDDVFGHRFREMLVQGGVGVEGLRTTDEPTGVSVILSNAEDRAILTLTGALAGITARDVRAAATGATHVHVAAYFLVPELARELPELLVDLRARGITTSLDTNWDPAERWEGVADCLPLIDVLLPNAAEARALAAAIGVEANDAESAARALAAGGATVVVKDGAAGGLGVQGDRLVRAAGLARDVVDTTGAGDSFDAGFLTAWTEGADLADAVRWAAVAGSLSTRASGGTRGQATREEAEEYV